MGAEFSAEKSGLGTFAKAGSQQGKALLCEFRLIAAKIILGFLFFLLL